MANNTAKKQPSLVDAAMSLKPTRRKSWFTNMPASDQAELLQLRSDYQAKKLPGHITVPMLHDLVRDRYGDAFPPTCDTFRDWLSRTD